MKKKHKKIAALLTTIGLVATLVGCGNSSNESKESSVEEESKVSTVASTEPASESSTVPEEPIVLTVLTRSNVCEDDALVFAEANKYIQEKLGFTVDFINLGQSSFKEKAQMMFAAGDYFDVCYTSSGVGFVDNVANGVYLALDDLLEEHGKDIYEAAPEYLFEAAKVNGEIYAVPHLKDLVFPQVFRVKDFFVQKYNLDISEVDTLEELTPILQTIKDNEPEYVPLLMKSNDNMTKILPYEKIAGTFVLAFDKENGEIVNLFETDEINDFLALMRDWNQRGFFPSDVETLTSLGDYTSSGLFACQVAAWSPGCDIKAKDATSATELIFGYSSELMTEPYLETANVMGAAWAISAETEHPEEAMEFINLIDTDAYLRNLMSYGIEGKHYVKAGENRINWPEGMTKAAETGYAPYSTTLGWCYNLYVKDAQPDDFWKQYEELNSTATPSPALGFVVDLNDIATEIAAIGNVYNEFGPALECGAVDPEENLSKFIDKLYSVGLQDVIDEVNAQYNEWKTVNGK